MYIACKEEECLGCLTCVVACLAQHAAPEAADTPSPRLHFPRAPQDGQYLTASCRHCADAPCLAACPGGALQRDTRGFVCLADEACTGCQSCLAACPHQVPRFAPNGKLVKCDGCTTRLACGLPPVCVNACPANALYLSDSERLPTP